MAEEFNKVVVIDIRMPFWSIVKFMVKFAIAAIPAAIILTLIFSFLSVFFVGLIGGGHTH